MALPRSLRGDVRGDAQRAHAGDEVRRVVALVGADAHASAPAAAALPGQQAQAGLALGRAVACVSSHVDDQAVAVLGQAVAGVAELRLLAVALARQAGLGVGGRAVRLRCRGARRGSRRSGLRPPPAGGGSSPSSSLDGPQALQRGGRLEQRAVDGEVLAGEQLVRLGLGADRREEGLGDLAGEQAVAVLGEAGRRGRPARRAAGPRTSAAGGCSRAARRGGARRGSRRGSGRAGRAAGTSGAIEGRPRRGVEGLELRGSSARARRRPWRGSRAAGGRPARRSSSVVMHDEPRLPLLVSAHRALLYVICRDYSIRDGQSEVGRPRLRTSPDECAGDYFSSLLRPTAATPERPEPESGPRPSFTTVAGRSLVRGRRECAQRGAPPHSARSPRARATSRRSLAS